MAEGNGASTLEGCRKCLESRGRSGWIGAQDGWLWRIQPPAASSYQSSLLLGMTSVLALNDTIACGVLLPVELAPGNDLSAGCGGEKAVSQTGSAVDT
jgi:hypothetical protein